jgi:hypothetical protein
VLLTQVINEIRVILQSAPNLQQGPAELDDLKRFDGERRTNLRAYGIGDMFPVSLCALSL